ncbi:protein RALF-like 32 [Actinidia eriantha]|uniref:protein RALF-like 32 n=1 Tax=Actinidia eriantha TaxID=165200 RepID=UPI00258CFE07|nr:protein RALF-like 32 [Actinidia eriantha]
METSPSKILSFHLSFLLLFLELTRRGASVFATSDTHVARVQCNGSIAECNADLEMLMESEVSRRFLQSKKYISPGALKRDQAVCNSGAKGEAYSKTDDCLPPESNPYNRGCSKYYRCRDGS